ncbi:MAG: S41 family peptidase [Chitinophagaceae bacterium]
MTAKYIAIPINCLKTFILWTVTAVLSTGVVAQNNDAAEFMVLLTNARKFSAEKKWKDAVTAWEKVKERNPVNGEYYAHLGSAYYNNAQYQQSIEAYKKQIELRFGLLANAAYNIACSYALAGEKEPAIEWLDKAFQMGFRSYTHAQADTDLKILQGDPRFVKILALEDVSKMSRVQGWQYDMEVLKKEVMRKAYLRRDLSMEAFNKQYDQLYNSIDKFTDVQMVMQLMKLMVNVGDGHSSVFPPSRKEFMLTAPVQYYFFKEGLYIVAADPKYRHLVGSKVLAFENKTVDEVSKTLSPFITRDNEMGVLQNLPSVMRHTPALHELGLTADPGKVVLKLQDVSGKETTATITADTSVVRVDHKSVPDKWVKLYEVAGKPVPLYLKNLKALYWFEKLPGTKTVYFQWNSVRNDKNIPLTQFTDNLMKYINENDVEKLVIDLRWNNGGNTMLLPYFINSIIKNEKINQRGNLFVITGRRTFSAAQNLATYLEKQTNATFVGEPTGSSPNFVGEEDFITLPYSKLAMNVSDWFWQSSWPWDNRTWIAPTIYVPPTFKAYSANTDEALETIRSFIMEGKKGF